jgi:hypothetical protein
MSISERREAVKELTAQGHTKDDIAETLGASASLRRNPAGFAAGFLDGEAKRRLCRVASSISAATDRRRRQQIQINPSLEQLGPRLRKPQLNLLRRKARNSMLHLVLEMLGD